MYGFFFILLHTSQKTQDKTNINSKYPLLLLLFQRKMHAILLLGCFVLAVQEYFLGSAHMIPEERLSTNRVVSLSQSLEIIPPPVVIVGKIASLNIHCFRFIKSQSRIIYTVSMSPFFK